MRDQVMPDLQAALAQAQQMQQKLMEAQQKIADDRGAGSGRRRSGAGHALNGNGKVPRCTIDPQVVDPDDVETLQDLVVGALDDAAENMRRAWSRPSSVRWRRWLRTSSSRSFGV